MKLDGFALPDAGGFGNSDGENDFMFGLPLLGSGVDAGGADEIELMIDGVEKNAHIAQDEVSKLCLLRSFCAQLVDIAFGFRDRPAVFRNQAHEAQLRRFVFDAQKRPRVAF